MNHLTDLYNSLMFWLYDSLLDDWNLPYDKSIAGPVAFQLAFTMRFAHNDDQPTLQSKPKFI